MLSFPNCKINIGLHVTEKRADGFHSIETILQPAGWQDILEIIPEEKLAETEIKCTGIRVFGTRETNLCYRAYKKIASVRELPPVRMHLHKIIPVGAGLGGGSSDAAHALLLLNKIFKLEFTSDELENFSQSLGSDCPFFIRNKTMLATGRGDQLEPVRLKLKNTFVVIVKPKIHVSTSAAYTWIKPRKRKESLKELIQLPLSDWKDAIENDFEKVVFEKYPVVKNIKNRLYKLGAFYASMSGSGSAVYGLFHEEKHLDTYFRSSSVWSGKL